MLILGARYAWIDDSITSFYLADVDCLVFSYKVISSMKRDLLIMSLPNLVVPSHVNPFLPHIYCLTVNSNFRLISEPTHLKNVLALIQTLWSFVQNMLPLVKTKDHLFLVSLPRKLTASSPFS